MTGFSADDDPDDLPLGAVGPLETEVGEEAGRPEDAEILLEEVLVEIIALPGRHVVEDGLLGDPVVPDDIDPLHRLLGESGGGEEEGQ